MFVAVSSYDKNGCKTLPSLLANGCPVESGADIGICDFGFRNRDLCSLNWRDRCDLRVAVRNQFLIELVDKSIGLLVIGNFYWFIVKRALAVH